MRTTYILIAFVAAAALFFYLASNFYQIPNPFVSGSSSSTPASNGDFPAANQPGIRNSTGSNTSGFQGPPPGKPGTGFIGPSAPPPNY